MEAAVVKYTGEALATLYGALPKTDNGVKMEIVDPNSMVFIISSLCFKPKGTKISLCENTIHVQEYWSLQGIQRWWGGDERDDLYQLKYPLLYFIGLKNQFIKLPDCFKTSDDQLSIMNEILTDGFDRLIETYQVNKSTGSMVLNCLSDYLKMLKKKYKKEEWETEIDEPGNQHFL